MLREGSWTPSTEGVPQGGSISPVLANISLHYAFDLWAHDWRKRNAHGDVIIVRYADDIVLGFEYRAEAEQLQRELSARLKEMSAEKSQGRNADVHASDVLKERLDSQTCEIFSASFGT